ncbi:hypothetical protein FQZ97_785010 [compost metagenome]
MHGVVEHLQRDGRAQGIHHEMRAATAGAATGPLGDRAVVGGEHLDALRCQGLHPLEQRTVAPGTEDAAGAHGQGEQRDAQPQGARDAIDEQRLAGQGAALAQRRVTGSQVAEPSRFLERDAVGQLDDGVLRRRHVFAKATVRIEVVDGLRLVLGEAEVAVEHEIVTGHAVVRQAGRARTTGTHRAHIDAVARLKADHLRADFDDHSGRVEAEHRRQLGLRQVRTPGWPVGQHIAQVGHHAAGLDLHQHIGGLRYGPRHAIDGHRGTDRVHASGAHRWEAHGVSPCLLFWGPRAGQWQAKNN